MGYVEAIEDGIEIYHNRSYKIPCEKCGRKIYRTQYSRTRTYLCDYCKGKINNKKKAYASKEVLETKTPKEIQFEKAIKEIENQVDDFTKYKNAIKIARTRDESYGSIPEAMVAIELLKNKYVIIPQQKVGKYRVDFALPRDKIVIEVDGRRYHDGIKSGREAKIQFSFGLDWKIIHIPAELIRDDIQKLKAIIDRESGV